MTEIRRQPGVSWWHVIVQIEARGYTHAQIAAAIGSARSTVQDWKNKDAEPRHEDGERLIALWRVVTGGERDRVPLKTDMVLSAATFR